MRTSNKFQQKYEKFIIEYWEIPRKRWENQREKWENSGLLRNFSYKIEKFIGNWEILELSVKLSNIRVISKTEKFLWNWENCN